ncbi:hypothetical protein AJ80_04315 [Polytolypa hystricis UAMH7299]|uniref:Nucleolar protein 9 n=1 Tax=Polytolypa hystricis (strain UAMH7299) TaxID=1447883 RepID=A0A2B7YE61_POLH7|nr:hypothetical protein AJ80_04315 [Polytolypa hystricis UAMH7299]
MPREKQKRGRRAEAKKQEESKRKREEEETLDTIKRQKSSHDDSSVQNTPQQQGEVGHDYIPLGDDSAAFLADDTPFFGLLDTEEQEYFTNANNLLELNQFEDEEERSLFIERVFEEADGKELKITCSQSSSRLMEKLISSSTAEQAKRLFAKFTGHFLHLVQHRFASHCCECLFVRSAPIVSRELETSQKAGKKSKEEDTGRRMEELLLLAIAELEGNWGYLLTERFASHAIRVLLLVLAGEPLDKSSNITVVASRKKENQDSAKITSQLDNLVSAKRAVPDSFKAGLKKMMEDLVTGLDANYLRALATHPVGNPVLQVLLTIEMTHLGKSKAKDPTSVLRKLVPDESISEGTDSAIFLKSLLYDPVGSRLMETIVRHCPGKFFKNLFRNLFRERIGSFARNEIAGYVVIRVLERLSKEDLQASMEFILPEIGSLVDRSRVTVIKTLIERCMVRNVDTAPLGDALLAAYGEDPIPRLQKILKLPEEPREEVEPKPNNNKVTSSLAQLHGSLLAQAMLKSPGSLADLIQSSLLACPPETIVLIAKNTTASHVLQDALSLPTASIQFRRQMTSKFSGKMTELALDTSGSHVADVLWNATTDLIFVKQRLAEELSQNEQTLRDSFFGRAVWRNWSMDLYKRKRAEWHAKAKGLDVQTANGKDMTDTWTQRPPSKLDLARARFAERAERQQAAKGEAVKVAATS